jgi:hypothetical protein
MITEDTLSTLFRALSHPHRRVVLYYLREHETTSLDELAACVTGWSESGPGAGADATPVDYEHVRIRLHHTHLPMLAESGFVTYDADSGEVRLGDLPPFAESVVSTAVATDAGDGELDVDALVASSEN